MSNKDKALEVEESAQVVETAQETVQETAQVVAKEEKTAKKEKTNDKKNGKNKKKDQKEKGKLKRKAKETISELKKVTWPSFGEVCKKTGVVLAVVLIFAVVIFGMDYGLGALVNLLRK